MAAIARPSRFAFRLASRSANFQATRGYADQMDFTFAAANKVFYSNSNVKQVDVPSFSGSFGILPNHVPTLAVLRPGVVTVFEQDGNSKKVFVSSGTVTINEDSSVQVLAEEAHPLEDFDLSAAKEQLNKAQADLSRASSELEKAEALIAVEVAEALVQATQ
ncbi:ATP synthase subunit delta, mitochondrial [Cimex lectularius]|uniref:F-ATPase delta subunit n=1 Tax=Cimex lectularius TaxID=79782 RepID=D1FPL2_CIMLE|nr:ATP synthase subunit delta, mitochondrial [Cimex lectularius]XP_024085252.1 ATP synthase subunit delta, mitochondrial [Cimex lectularius]